MNKDQLKQLSIEGCELSGTLALLLNRLQRNPFAVTHIKYDMNERIKRLGVYYLCIDDLLL